MSDLLRRPSLTLHDTHPSLSASLESVPSPESATFAPAMPNLPSQHSGFLENSDPAMDSSVPAALWPYNPQEQMRVSPATSDRSGNAWYRRSPYHHPGRTASPSSHQASISRTGSVEDPAVVAARVPLPRGTSTSPERDRTGTPAQPGIGNNAVARPTSMSAPPVLAEATPPNTPEGGNFFRFSMQTEVMHRTDTIESMFTFFQNLFHTRRSIVITLVVTLFSLAIVRMFTTTPANLPAPDVIKVAGLARSFEPMMYYSENSVTQIKELQETGVAVWDLGESVRQSNFTSAPIIVKELEELSGSLRALSHEMTNFFTYIDNDIDTILSTMDWARRELSALPKPSNFVVAVAKRNAQDYFSRSGVLANYKTGEPTFAGRVVSFFVGCSEAEYQRAALQKAFREMLNTFEDTINQELGLTTTLFALFTTIDRQFLNVQRSTIREFDTQERLENELLSSLWLRAVGGQRAKLKKFEKNKALLQNVRQRTVSNRNLVEEHNGKLMALKQSLEGVRRRIFSPLLKVSDESHIGLAEQIQGLEAIWSDLRSTRESRRTHYMEALYGGSATRRIDQLKAGKLGGIEGPGA